MKTVNIVLIFLLSFSFVQYGIIKTNNSEITDRLASISINRGDDSINERLNYYSHSLESISENPLFGIGIGNWKIWSIKYDSMNIENYIIPKVYKFTWWVRNCLRSSKTRISAIIAHKKIVVETCIFTAPNSPITMGSFMMHGTV